MAVRFLSLLFLASISSIAAASDYLLSESSVVSLLSCAKGERVFESYGHSAIRVVDTINHADVVFNYGAFNSSENQFYIDFLMGKPTFYLVIVPTSAFLKEYEIENRTVTESSLNLTLAQRQRIFDYLLWNAGLENYAYQYDFVYNNCATKIYEVLKKQLKVDGTLTLVNLPATQKLSIKKMLIENIKNHPLVALGFYTILGSKLDKYPTQAEWLFLPKNLKTTLENASLNGLPLVSKTRLVSNKELSKSDMESSMLNLFLIALAILLLLSLLLKNKKMNFYIVQSLLFLLGLLGLFLVCMWLFTNNDSTFWNWNLLWANPLFSAFLFYIHVRQKKLFKKAISIHGILMLLILIFFILFTKHLFLGYYFLLFTTGCYFVLFPSDTK